MPLVQYLYHIEYRYQLSSVLLESADILYCTVYISAVVHYTDIRICSYYL